MPGMVPPMPPPPPPPQVAYADGRANRKTASRTSRRRMDFILLRQGDVRECERVTNQVLRGFQSDAQLPVGLRLVAPRRQHRVAFLVAHRNALLLPLGVDVGDVLDSTFLES